MKQDHFTKRQLYQLVIDKLKSKGIHKYHIISIINIFIEEMIKEIKIGNKIKIGNFATFGLVDLKSKMLFSVSSKIMKLGKASRALRIKLDRKLIKIIK